MSPKRDRSNLDRFKAINEAYGHHVGDKVLCEVAQRLEATIIEETISIARLGGDEFAVLFPTDNDPDLGTRIGQRIVTGLSRPILIDPLLTESCLLDAGDFNVEILTAIRALGIQVAIDDLGTGYASINHLQGFFFSQSMPSDQTLAFTQAYSALKPD